MRVLVTGAAGHIGSVVAQHLAGSGFEVRATDNRFRPGLAVRLDLADLTDPHAAYRLLDGVEAVVHLGNLPSSKSGTPQHVMNTNTAINTNVFVAARELGLKRIVFASTIQTMLLPSAADAYSHPRCRLPHLPADGGSPVCLDNNYYALNKIFAEQMLQGLVHADDQMICTALRFPSVPSPKWIKRLREGKDRWLFRPNEGFTYLPVEEAASLVEAALLKQSPGYHCYFPAQSCGVRGWSLQQLIEHYLSEVPPREPGITPDRIVDMRQIETDLGWKPSEPVLLFDPPSEGV